MPRVLLLFAHPALEKSRINARLIRDVGQLDGITFHDLYEAYPDFFVDVAAEQQLLAAHDVIVLHHPLFWYSSPALVKQWADLVLEHGWAYGAKGTALRGKQLVHVVTTGGSEQAYQTAGLHKHTLREFLLPFEQTARLCGMLYLPPFWVHGTHRLADDEIERFAQEYVALLQLLHAGHYDLENWLHCESCNQFLQHGRK